MTIYEKPSDIPHLPCPKCGSDRTRAEHRDISWNDQRGVVLVRRECLDCTARLHALDGSQDG